MPASLHSVDSNHFIYLYNVCYCYSPHQYPRQSPMNHPDNVTEFTLMQSAGIFLPGLQPRDPGVTSQSSCCLWLWVKVRGVEFVIYLFFLNPDFFYESLCHLLFFINMQREINQKKTKKQTLMGMMESNTVYRGLETGFLTGGSNPAGNVWLGGSALESARLWDWRWEKYPGITNVDPVELELYVRYFLCSLFPSLLTPSPHCLCCECA